VGLKKLLHIYQSAFQQIKRFMYQVELNLK